MDVKEKRMEIMDSIDLVQEREKRGKIVKSVML